MNRDIEEFLEEHGVKVDYDKDYNYEELRLRGYTKIEWEGEEYYIMRKRDYNEIEALIYDLLKVPIKRKDPDGNQLLNNIISL